MAELWTGAGDQGLWGGGQAALPWEGPPGCGLPPAGPSGYVCGVRAASALVMLLLAACGQDAARDDATADATDTTDQADIHETDAATADADADNDDDDDADNDDDADGDDTDAADTHADSDVARPSETVEADVPTTVVRPPALGELVVSELMIDPVGRSDLVGEWLELVNLTDDATLDLEGCWLEAGDGRRAALRDAVGLARVSPGAAMVVARSDDRDDNGGLDPDLVQTVVLLPNASGTLNLGCGSTTFQTVTWDATWPLAPGRALVIPAGASSPAAACAATAAYDGANRGTPGVVDAACPARDATLDGCGLVRPPAGDVLVGASLDARLWIEGLRTACIWS